MIDTDALRKKVIDLAIQGKLTEQLPSDGNAEELYAKIQEEKAKLIKEGRIKKNTSLPEINEDKIPFEIPKNWKWTYLGEIFDHNTGKALNSADKEGILLEYITTSNLYWDHFELDSLKSMFFKDSEIEKCTIRKGDLLICEGGDIGRSAIWNFEYEMRIQNHIHKLRGYGKIEPKYYYYILRNYKDHGLIDGHGMGLQGFSSNKVHFLVVPLPPLAEQKRIVDKIDEIVSQIAIIDDLQSKYINDSAVLRNKILDAAIRGKLVDQNESESVVDLSKIKNKKTDEFGFEIPITWQIGHIESISKSISSKQYQISLSEFKTKGKYPVVSQSKEYIIGYSDDETKLYHHDHPLIVFGDHTTIVKYIDFDFVVGAEGIKIFEPNESIISAKFFYIVLEYYSNGLKKVGGYSRHYKYLKNKPIPLPPLAEQRRIVARIEELLPLCERLAECREKA